MSRTSDKAPRILEFISQFVLENGYAPSVREIGEAVDLHSTASVSYHIKALKKQGLLANPAGKGSKRCLIPTIRPGQIPVVVNFAAGTSPLDIENQDGTVSWDGEPGCFAMHMADDSLTSASILSGDRLVVRPQTAVEDGQVVVVRVDDQAVVGHVSSHDGKTWVENDHTSLDVNSVEVLGLVRSVVRNY